MTVFIVNNGSGGLIDSVWLDKKAAFAERDRLNSEKGYSLGWKVTALEVK